MTAAQRRFGVSPDPTGSAAAAIASARLVVVIPTKDRSLLLQDLLADLDGQTCRPARVIIVDASRDPLAAAAAGFGDSRWVEVLPHQPPSAAAQRNRGIRAVLGQAPLIALLDDDIVLAPDALERMLAFWSSPRAAGVVGAGFNQVDAASSVPRGGLKRSRLAERLGLYARRPGAVAPSGWQSLIGSVDCDTAVDWLPTGAAVWRADLLQEIGGFDEYFISYSYLEDLDLSWRARRRGPLVVVADAKFEHRYATAGKIGAVEFGRFEVRNRLYFVRKHGLSAARCWVGLLIRSAMTLVAALRHRDRVSGQRLLGNLRGLAEQLCCFRNAVDRAAGNRPRRNTDA